MTLMIPFLTVKHFILTFYQPDFSPSNKKPQLTEMYIRCN